MKKTILILTACILNTMLFSQTHWIPVSSGTSGSMVLIGKIQINGVDQTSDQLELGVFCDNECRGAVIAHVFDYIQPSYYMVDPMVYGEAGNSYTFKLYDHSINQELNLTSPEPFTFTENGYGTVFDPYILNFTGSTTPQLHWSPISSTTSGSMVVIGKIQINGVDQTSDQLELGVFCGEECRGAVIAHLFDYIQLGYYMVDPMVYGEAGNFYTFKLYDHSINQELDLISPEAITFTENGYGNVFSPYVLNFIDSTSQTYTLPITGYGTSICGYYLIAPPIDDVNPAEIVGMTDGDYDLYYFDQSEELEWRNYKTDHFDLESGKGYLYAHKTDVNLTFSGVPYNGDGKVPLAYTEGKPFAGWNLIGNPFDQVAYLADNRDFFVINSYGDEIIPAITKDIQPMQGVFVVAANAMDSDVVFTTDMPASDDRAICLEISKDYSTVAIDRAIIRFGEGPMLPKIMLDEGNTEVYIPRGNVNYSVVRSNNEDEIPVNFKASEDGAYIVSVNTENVELDYLHLIDNLTGDDVDLLQNPSYRFEAQTNDYASRFKLVFVSNANGLVENYDSFAYYNSDAWIITNQGEALLQVIDLKGCMLSNQVINGNAKVSINVNPGVYMLRLVSGDDMKVQKIIIQ